MRADVPATGTPPATAAPGPATRVPREACLAGRVLDALLREDYGGLTGHVRGDRLHLPGGRDVALSRATPDMPRAPDAPGATAGGPAAGTAGERSAARRGRYPGFLSDLVVDDLVTLEEIFTTVRALADPRDDVAAFERECREALRALRLSDAVRPRPDGPTRYETLAATVDHPVYPTARCRLGLDERDLLAYAPEFGPSFRLRWTAVPHSACRGERPAWWPAAGDLGLPAGHDVLPVHPLTARLLPTVPGPAITVRPTLSMRTVATGPREQLKLPLPTSTLGLRNRRVIVPRTLADGALVERVLRAVLAQDGPPVLLADEQTYGHAEDPLLGYLVRRLPADGVPVAALLAPASGGRYVIEELTDDVEAFFGAYLGVLFGWNVPLLTRYGIALEAHQQNVSVIPGDPLRLMVKDNDGALIDVRRLGGSLGHAAPVPGDFGDHRMLTSDPEALARVFVTITVHLCAGAIAFGLAERGLLPLRDGLGLIRDHLGAALDAYDDTGFLRARTLDADRLPGKAMITAGTLAGRDRIQAEDINKHYGPPGPNYLKRSTS